ncbi:PKD domain-containing protein, partial [Rhizobium leguminosarum]
MFPKDSVTLTGTATDEDGTIAAYLWSQISGPSASIIRNPGSA